MRAGVFGAAALSLCLVISAVSVGYAQSPPPSAPPPATGAPLPGFVPPYEITRIVRAAGYDPLTRPRREGTTYVVRATNYRGILMRIVVDARSGAIRAVNRIVPGPAPYGVVGMMAPPPPFGGAKGPLWDWKRASINAFYTLGSLRNNTDGDFNTPPTGNLQDDWAPAIADVRHRLFIGLISQTLRNFNVLMNLSVTSGAPYSIRTGRDDNADGIFNDRPSGVGRNTLRASGQLNVNLMAGYLFAFGRYEFRNTKDMPAVVLIDLNLPNVSGLDVLRRMRADYRTKLVPVVIFTSSPIRSSSTAPKMMLQSSCAAF